MLPSFCTDEVAVIRAAVAESRGTRTLDWANATEHVLAGCSVQPGSTVRTMDDRALAVANGATLYAPQGADIQAGDRVRFGNITYETDGAPMEHRSPTGRVSHIEVPLREWEG